MPEQDYDRLEQFFRKAAAKADVTFNEDDWKKLEARLDAATAGKAVVKKAGTRIAVAIVVGALLLVSTAVWVSSNYGIVLTNDTVAAGEEFPEENGRRLSESPETGPDLSAVPNMEDEDRPRQDQTGASEEIKPRVSAYAGPETAEDPALPAVKNQVAGVVNAQTRSGSIEEIPEIAGEKTLTGDKKSEVSGQSPDIIERNKQKAVVELPGAEEEKTREAEALVQEEHASDNKKHVATPRLSLLLFFAPDFSGTSIGLSPSPGKAFGAMLHYHPFNRWSISAGVIKNYKQYTGAGEDYKPPRNYWKYYTNGIIPETIDGSCSILEFPVMIQYTAIRSARNKWNVGMGVSSYLMQSESYRYHFAQPNPGAKEGWDSRGNSRFFLNMVNFTIGYERQITPGLMLGIEPYAKIPLEEIGWSNLKLFSSGASFTLRYTILGKDNLDMPARSRGPG